MMQEFLRRLEESAINNTPGKQKAIEVARQILHDAGVEVNPLTPREQRVIQYMAKGFGNKQIGTLLEISPETVVTYSGNIHKKLGAHSRGEAMIAGVKRGIIDLDEAAEGRNLELVNGLTKRENEVLKTMIEEETTRDEKIAQALSTEIKRLKPRTVETHRSNLLQKLEATGIDQALIIFMAAEKQGIIKERKEKDLTLLTPQQMLIFKLSAKGLNDEEVRLQLNISRRTVGVHKIIIYRKLGAHNQAEMIMRKVNGGLVDIEDCVDEEMKPKLNDLIHLLPKEKEVLETMIKLQRTNHKVIGTSMNISSRTVDTHVRNLLKKLDLHKIDRALALYMLHQKMQTNSQPPASPL